MDNMYAVIMAGGKGERFWPLSTSKRPKQVLSLIAGKPMLSLAIDRLKGFIPPKRILVITSASLVDVIRDATPELPPENIIGEPFGRDTAAACALGSAIVKSRSENAAFCILTADHVIKNIDLFQQTLREGFELAFSRDVLVTIGIQPAFPSTGFGYIEAGETIENNGDIQFKKAVRFVEKPDSETAASYLKAGNYFWNSGMFIWSVEAFQKAIELYQPDLTAMASVMEKAVQTDEFSSILKDEYEKLGKISVDYAIMEKADNIVSAVGKFGWFDVGSWPALADHFDLDDSDNVLIGDCRIIDSEANIVYSEGRLTAMIGVQDLVVVQAENATLICPRNRAQEVKAMVKLLEDGGEHDHLL